MTSVKTRLLSDNSPCRLAALLTVDWLHCCQWTSQRHTNRTKNANRRGNCYPTTMEEKPEATGRKVDMSKVSEWPTMANNGNRRLRYFSPPWQSSEPPRAWIRRFFDRVIVTLSPIQRWKLIRSPRQTRCNTNITLPSPLKTTLCGLSSVVTRAQTVTITAYQSQVMPAVTLGNVWDLLIVMINCPINGN